MKSHVSLRITQSGFSPIINISWTIIAASVSDNIGSLTVFMIGQFSLYIYDSDPFHLLWLMTLDLQSGPSE